MESERAEGFVLRCQPVTESSLIITWYTRECGKLRTLAKGARRRKSPLRGKLDLFYRDEFLFLRSRRSELHLLQDCFLDQPHIWLRQSVAQMAAASYACELVDLATASEDVNDCLFEVLAEFMASLCGGVEPVAVIWFELHVMQAIGWGRAWDGMAGSGTVLRSLGHAGLPMAARVRLSAAQWGAARQALDAVWREEIGRLPRSQSAVLREIRR